METYRCNSYVYVSNDAAYAQFSLSPHLLMYFVLLLVLFFVSYVFLLYIYISICDTYMPQRAAEVRSKTRITRIAEKPDCRNRMLTPCRM